MMTLLGQSRVTADSVSSHNLTLRHDEAQATYKCLLSTGELASVRVNVTSGGKVTVNVQSDTMYTIGCVGYDEQGQDLCVEANTTITTREQRHIKAYLQKHAFTVSTVHVYNTY